MSKLQQKIQRARKNGCYVLKIPQSKCWTVYIEGEYCPRAEMTKRGAVNLAYAISKSKKLKLVVTFNVGD